MCTGVAMRTLIDNEGAAEFVHIELVRTEQPDEIDLALARAVENARHIAAVDEAEIERANARGRGMQHIETDPTAFCWCTCRADGAAVARDLRGDMQDRRAIRARQRTGADDDHRTLRILQNFREGMAAIGDS